MIRAALACLVAVLVVASTDARAQAPGDATTRSAPGKCVRTPPTTAATPADGMAPPPVTWSDFELEGALSEDQATVRALIEPTMQRHRALTDTAREDLANVTAAFGYHLVGLRTKETTTGIKAVVHLAPMPMVRTVEIAAKGGLFDRLDDDIRRRMRLRTGAYLPWKPDERRCDLDDEARRLQEFLADEGYFDAVVTITPRIEGRAVTLRVNAALGSEYEAAKPKLAPRASDAISDKDILDKFEHDEFCLVGGLCFGTARFRRSQLQEDLKKVERLFQEKNYPGVRVRSDYDPAISADRTNKEVRFTVFIEQRRLVEVVFEGYNQGSVAEQDLRDQLTFNQAASADDLEANNSARALAAYLQARGYFDARVSWSRERFDTFDRIVFRIEQGAQRQVRSVEFVGNHATGFDGDALSDLIGTRTSGGFSTSLFGKKTAPTSLQLSSDVDSIVSAYRRAGYREARVWVTAATSLAALESASLTAALVLAERGEDLYVRYHIDEGLPTLLTQIRIGLSDRGDAITTPEQRELCTLALGELAAIYEEPQLATPADKERCVATAAGLKFRELDVTGAADQLRDRLFSHGRPRARVTYEPQVLGTRRVAATYKLSNVQPLRVGKVIIRGNFRTRSSVIRDLLAIDEGQPLTKDKLATGARNLRNTGLFEAVNIAMPDLDNVSEGSVNAVVEVTERYDFGAAVQVAGGFSSFNGTFATLGPSFKNIGGRGISLDLEGTLGFELTTYLESRDFVLKQLAAEARLAIPAWLSPIAFRTELLAFRRIQDTPRFGQLTTDGVTLSQSRTFSRSRTASQPARAITFSPSYNFRRRERPVDVLRPAGADDNESQVPISTRTGSLGVNVEWEQRVDRAGSLSPLAPEGGFRLEGQAMFASPYLGGQNTFLKLSGAGSKWWSLGSNLILRADLRFDQGIPLAGEVLLPEVERFFAGGDSTVRGYEDDRLATEVIEVGVPPYDNVQQIRILPAGGNIRVMSSLDAQLRIWKVFATGAFVDAGLITNAWGTVTEDDIRPSVGLAMLRIATPFGTGAIEWAVPVRPQLGDNPRGRLHFWFAARAQF